MTRCRTSAHRFRFFGIQRTLAFLGRDHRVKKKFKIIQVQTREFANIELKPIAVCNRLSFLLRCTWRSDPPVRCGFLHKKHFGFVRQRLSARTFPPERLRVDSKIEISKRTRIDDWALNWPDCVAAAQFVFLAA